MNTSEVKAAIEAVLFAAGEAMPIMRLAEAIGVGEEEIEDYIKIAMHDYDVDARGIKIVRLENSVRLVTKPEFAPQIKAALDVGRVHSISPQAMEVLAIVAYNQPVTRTYIEQVRGVDCTHSLQNLIERNLVEEAGVLDAPGRPKLYATTGEFLRMFGISSINELPSSDGEEITMDKLSGVGQ